ncbi:MAG: histidine kinase dimerization/phospho-acceptor domain-containing protein, partial [Bacillota bacterium]
MSIRLRLAFWYGVLLAALVLVFGGLIYSSVQAYLRDDLRASTRRLGDHFAESLRTAADGSSVEPLLKAFEAPDTLVAIYDTDGTILARSGSAPGAVEALAGPQFHGLPEAGQSPAGALAAEGFIEQPLTGYRVVRRVPPPNRLSESRPVLAVAVGWFSSRQALLDHLLRVLAGGAVLATVAAVALGWAMAGGALRPISAMIDTARAIAASRSFGRRLPVERRHDELGRLAAAFNEMLAALEQAFENQRRFVADASHELRAPLATIQGNLELLERAATLPEPERQAIWEDIRDEVRRLGRLVSDLLSLARAESGQPLQCRPVELDRVVTDVLRSMRVEMARHRLTVEHLEPVQVLGDPDRLRELLVILLDNAIRYTPEGGRIRVKLVRQSPGVQSHAPHGADGAGEAELVVEDTGIGISAEDLPHIFERFYRADKARSR